jgi:hypothetical protein
MFMSVVKVRQQVPVVSTVVQLAAIILALKVVAVVVRQTLEKPLAISRAELR